MIFPISAIFGDEEKDTFRAVSVANIQQDGKKTRVEYWGEGGHYRNDLGSFTVPYKARGLFNAMAQSKANDEDFVDLTDKACEKLISEGKLKPSSSSSGLFGNVFG